MPEAYTNDEIIGKADYGVPIGAPKDAKTLPPLNFPAMSTTVQGLVAIGPKG